MDLHRVALADVEVSGFEDDIGTVSNAEYRARDG
jgi:hypothetical protein